MLWLKKHIMYLMQKTDTLEVIDGAAANKRDNKNHWKKMNSDAKIKLSMAQKKEKFNKFHYGLNSPTKNEIYRWTKGRIRILSVIT